jgi:hypothetical protein
MSPVPEDTKDNNDETMTTNDLISHLKSIYRRLTYVPRKKRSLPLDWLDVHKSSSYPREIDDMAKHIYDITTLIDDPTEVPLICNKIFPLAFLSIASGAKNKIVIIHSIWQGNMNNGVPSA